jgi:choline-sulfatase
MIVAGPDVPAGRVCRTNASLVDVYPTVLENMGLAPEGDERALPGRSLLDLARSADDTDRAGFSEYHAVGAQTGGFMLTRGRYKYHHYVGFAPELFDLEADPEETRDLAADPAHAPVLREFEARLRAMVDPEVVDRRAKDAQNALVARYGGPDAVRHMGNPGSTPTPDKFR